MSPTMQSLMKAKDSKGMVDLYYNDYWGVRVTME
jgi:hypothetical protein